MVGYSVERPEEGAVRGFNHKTTRHVTEVKNRKHKDVSIAL